MNETTKDKEPKKGETKEEFCSLCVAGISALGGMTVASTSSSRTDKHHKKLSFWIGVGITIVSILIMIYYLCFEDCESCR